MVARNRSPEEHSEVSWFAVEDACRLALAHPAYPGSYARRPRRRPARRARRALSRYDVEQGPGGRLTAVARPRLFETPFVLPQPRLFPLDASGEAGWVKVLKLPDYAPREPRRPPILQEVLFPYPDAL